MSHAKVVSLHIYPVKSCRGLTVGSFEVQARGPRYDREWMIVDEENGRFFTQRELPLLATVETALTDTSLKLTFHSLLSHSIEVPLAIDLEAPRATKAVRIWNDDCLGIDEGKLAAEAFSEIAKKKLRLVRMAPEFRRLLPEKYQLPKTNIGFADLFPLLLVSMSSLRDLNSRLPSPVGIDRFRGNVVIDGPEAFAEDSWKSLKIGRLDLSLPKPCSRCVIVNVDQETGERSPAVLKTLAGYRMNADRKIIFGQNMAHLNQGTLNVGDLVVP